MAKECTIFTVDAFTASPFAGNPAAVCILEGPLSEEVMQKIAKEMNLSETAFVYPLGGNRFSLKWFTPTNEVPLCGHATMATSYAIITKTNLTEPNSPLIFETLSGDLTVAPLPKESPASSLFLQMDFPLGKPQPISSGWSNDVQIQLLCALGTRVDSKITDIQFCGNTNKLLVVFEHLQDILSLNPTNKLLEIQFPVNVRGVICTTRDKQGFPEYRDYDIISRYFSPWNGIPEDPVTGSAHTVIGPYWQNIMNRNDELKAFQASPGRGGELFLKIESNKQRQRIFLRGTASVVVSGTMILPS